MQMSNVEVTGSSEPCNRKQEIAHLAVHAHLVGIDDHSS